MEINYTAYVHDIDKGLYEETVDEVVANILYHTPEWFFGKVMMPSSSILEQIKNKITDNSHLFIEFPDEFIFDCSDTHDVEDRFWEILYNRIFNAFKLLFHDKDIYLYLDNVYETNLDEYEVKTWEEYTNKIDDYCIVLFKNDEFICYYDNGVKAVDISK